METGWSMLIAFGLAFGPALSLVACGEKESDSEIETEVEDSAEVEEDYSDYCNEDSTQNLIEDDQDCDGFLAEDDCDDENPDSLTIFEDPECDGFYLAQNGVTVMCPEALVGDQGIVNGDVYTKIDREELETLIRWDWMGAEASCTTGITDMRDMFRSSSFNGDISSWDVSNVTNMESMFEGSFFSNENLSFWDVSNVANMSWMFLNSSFNGNISSWDVSNVTNMEWMFVYSPFNGDISTWDVSNVTNMRAMFLNSSFTGDLSFWDVSNVMNMEGMFGNSIFAGNISSWDVSNVTNIDSMFKDATSFNQDLSSWCVSNFPSTPTDFDTGAISWTEPKPIWGTCP